MEEIIIYNVEKKNVDFIFLSNNRGPCRGQGDKYYICIQHVCMYVMYAMYVYTHIIIHTYIKQVRSQQ